MLPKEFPNIVVDTQWLPQAIHITTANITDREGAIEAFALNNHSLVEVKKEIEL